MRWVAFVSVPVLLSACSSKPPAETGWAGSVDTLPSGRIVVHDPDVGTWTEPHTLRERLRLGSMAKDGPELFGSIDGLALGPNGEVYVMDGQAGEVRVFGSDGTFQRAFGREGAGPGELRNPAGMALDEEGTLWVMDWGNARYDGFDPATGTPTRAVARRMSFAAFPWPGAFESGGRLVDEGLDATGEPAIIRLDSAFVPTDTLPLPQPSDRDRIWFRRGSVAVASMMEPFAPQPAWAPRPRGGIVLGREVTYRLDRIGFDGDTTLTIELDRKPAMVTDEERDSALAFFRTMASSLPDARPDRRPEARRTKPAHGMLLVDDQDRTWVVSIPPARAPRTWDVFDANGKFLGQVPMPDPIGHVRPAVRDDRMAVATQVDGYPVVVVYELVALGR